VPGWTEEGFSAEAESRWVILRFDSLLRCGLLVTSVSIAAGGLRAEAHSDVSDGEVAAENGGAKDRLDVDVLEVGEISIDRQEEKIEGWRKEMQVHCVISHVGDR
jgi:hypothetical protein